MNWRTWLPIVHVSSPLPGDAFSSRHKTSDWEIDLNLNSIERRQSANCSYSAQFGQYSKKTEGHFRLYGKRALQSTPHVFNLMVMHSTGNLEILEMNNCWFLRQNKIMDGTALLRNVKELRLEGTFSGIGSWFSEASQLTRLTLYRCSPVGANDILSNDFSQLQALALKHING